MKKRDMPNGYIPLFYYQTSRHFLALTLNFFAQKDNCCKELRIIIADRCGCLQKKPYIWKFKTE